MTVLTDAERARLSQAVETDEGTGDIHAVVYAVESIIAAHMSDPVVPTTDRDAERPLTDRVEFTDEQLDRLGHWLSECLDDAAPLNERVWRSRVEWMVKGPTFQAVLADLMGDGLADAWDEGYMACADDLEQLAALKDRSPNIYRRVTDDGEGNTDE